MLATERIESLKAGTTGAAIAVLTYPLIPLGHRLLLQAFPMESLTAFTSLPLTLFDLSGLVRWTIAAIAGFLFGVTYRYIVRQDSNAHLRDGAVLAFGLVRGLAQVDLGLTLGLSLITLAIFSGESLLLFALVRLGLDRMLHSGLIQPFGTMSQGSDFDP